MPRRQIIRISLLLLAIFASGIMTGRLTAPSAKAPVRVTTVRGREVTVDSILNRIALDAGLDDKQREQLRPILEDLALHMNECPPGTRERLNLFRTATPKMRAHLHPEQYQAFDRHVRLTERQFERNIRRRPAQRPPVNPSNE